MKIEYFVRDGYECLTLGNIKMPGLFGLVGCMEPYNFLCDHEENNS